MGSLTRRLLNWLTALDQFAFNTATLGHSSPDETLSAAAWRWEQSKKLQGRILRPLIDMLFWFDPAHCQSSFESERNRAHLPDAYKQP